MKRLKFKVEIDCEGDAFKGYGALEAELGRILHDIAAHVATGYNGVRAQDINGNCVGFARFE